MAKDIKYAVEAREKLKAGVDKLTKAVVTTLGPKGRNVALDKKWGAPNVVHDGVTVAKEVELKDPLENMGAQLVQEAASKTNDVAGDGTTTAVLLAREIIHLAFEEIERGADPMEMRQEILTGVDVVVGELKELANPIKEDEIEKVASVAAIDQDIGRTIAEAFKEVGKDGVITVEEGKGLKTEVEYKKGMLIDKGYTSPYFITDTGRLEAVVEDAHLLVTDQKLSSMNDLLPLLENITKVTKNIVIIADDIEGEALATLVVNKLRGTLNALAVKAPGFGERRKEMLQDIATLTGANFISEEAGRKLESATLEDLGKAERVVAGKEETVIVGGGGQKKEIEARIAQLRKQVEKTDSDFDREKLEERLAKLVGGVAVIYVGAATEVELKEKKHRVEDAYGATKAALEEGVVPGGGVALLRAREALVKERGETEVKKAPKGMGRVVYREHGLVGWKVLYLTLAAPLRHILINATPKWKIILRDIIHGEITVTSADGRTKKGKKAEAVKLTNYGYDVITDSYEDMLKVGIIDPVKVTRSALQNAASVAVMVLTTEALITDIPEEKKPTPGGPTPGMPPQGY